MSGFGRAERLQQERRLRQATAAVQSVHEVVGPLAQAVEQLDARESRHHTLTEKYAADLGRDINLLHARIDGQIGVQVARDRSFWTRLQWLFTGRIW